MAVKQLWLMWIRGLTCHQRASRQHQEAQMYHPPVCKTQTSNIRAEGCNTRRNAGFYTKWTYQSISLKSVQIQSQKKTQTHDVDSRRKEMSTYPLLFATSTPDIKMINRVLSKTREADFSSEKSPVDVLFSLNSTSEGHRRRRSEKYFHFRLWEKKKKEKIPLK